MQLRHPAPTRYLLRGAPDRKQEGQKGRMQAFGAEVTLDPEEAAKLS